MSYFFFTLVIEFCSVLVPSINSAIQLSLLRRVCKS